MKPILTKEQIAELYSREDERGQKLLCSIFGQDAFVKRPIGVWCVFRIADSTELHAIHHTNCRDDYHLIELGVAVVTEDAAFIIAPHNTVAVPWSPINAGRCYVELITDKESLDAAQATDCIVGKYSGVLHVDSNGKTQYNFIGAPAADFCRKYSRDNIVAGKWHLPTVAQLKIIADNIAEVNACFRAMRLPSMSIGWYWSSIAYNNDNRFAWVVYIGNGDVYYGRKDHCSYLRAVHPFDISAVCFTHPSSAE